jgi:pyruvate/2-oxoglutarate dehydrogenase complex dihydrolipoamide dehydrogenase (E3) component
VVELGKEVTPELVDELKPDVVIVATGARSLRPSNMPGIDKELVVSAWDVLGGQAAAIGKNVVIVGGGLVGCEIADFMAEAGDNLGASPTKVTIVEMLEDVATDMSFEARHLLMQRLRTKGVRILTRTEVKEILDDGVVIVRDGQEESIRGVEHVVLAMGATSCDELSAKIVGKVAEVHVIGDAVKPRRILEATAEAAEIGRKI